jgi:hypothetical protein
LRIARSPWTGQSRGGHGGPGAASRTQVFQGILILSYYKKLFCKSSSSFISYKCPK